ncbi:MAG: hypothetical protein PHX21_12960 [bacterium]|nr:hypothetical protein [bacterium]
MSEKDTEVYVNKIFRLEEKEGNLIIGKRFDYVYGVDYKAFFIRNEHGVFVGSIFYVHIYETYLFHPRKGFSFCQEDLKEILERVTELNNNKGLLYKLL